LDRSTGESVPIRHLPADAVEILADAQAIDAGDPGDLVDVGDQGGEWRARNAIDV